MLHDPVAHVDEAGQPQREAAVRHQSHLQRRDQDVHGQAPSRLWPQTRTTWPVRPELAPWANQAMVSATSIGRPPWLRLLILRPSSRVARGILAVISVSMKPGATALTVMPRPATCGDKARRG